MHPPHWKAIRNRSTSYCIVGATVVVTIVARSREESVRFLLASLVLDISQRFSLTSRFSLLVVVADSPARGYESFLEDSDVTKYSYFTSAYLKFMVLFPELAITKIRLLECSPCK